MPRFLLAFAVSLPYLAPASATADVPCPSWPLYGASLARTFSAPCPTPISMTNVATLLPAWVFDTQKTVTASPVVADGVVYVGDWTGTMYAINAADGSEKWRYQTIIAPGAAFGPIVSSAAIADLPTRRLVIFGAGPRLYALDASNGSLVWVRYVGAVDGNGDPVLADDPSEVESSPLVWNDTVYVGMDTHNRQDEDSGGIRGGLLAIDVFTGAVVWKFEPELSAGEGCGGMWSSPVLDPSRGLVYMGTANCEKDPPEFTWTPHVEAITAVDAGTGLPVWSFQPHLQNRLDVDFGATPNLFVDLDGRPVLGAGNKDATYYALDPSTGALLWSTLVAEPGNIMDDFAVGGFIGSPAISGGHVFGGTALGGAPYFHALDGRTGAILWQDFTASPSYAASGTANGLVFHGALDNVFRAYDAATGLILYSTALQGPISSGPAIVGDTVYVGSGTSSSDACQKPSDDPLSEVAFQACLDAFDEAVGATGAVHALRLPSLPTTTTTAAPTTSTTAAPTTSTTTVTVASTTTTTTAPPGSNLNVIQARLRSQTAAGRGNGSLRVQGDFTTPPAFSVPPPFTVRVRDSLALDRTHTFTAPCRTTASGRIICRESAVDGMFRADFAPIRRNPGAIRFRVSFQRQAISGPFAAPVTVTLTHNGGVARTDSIMDCRAVGSGLNCREF